MIVFLVAAAALPDGSLAAPAVRPIRFTTRTMGTTVTLTLVGADSLALAPLATRVLAGFTRVDSLMSNWTGTSEVARINAALDGTVDGAPLAPEPETARVLAAALQVAAESAGAFDPTVEPLVRLWGFLGGARQLPDSAAIAALLPDIGFRKLRCPPAADRLSALRPGLRLDLGGIAKGHAVDCARDSLVALGVQDALVDLSGNIALLGAPPGRAAWRLGLRDPADREHTLGTLTLPRAAVATSGDYEQFVAAGGRRYGHILDPRSGWPVDSLASVTVVMDSATLADAWATALTVLGPTAARRLARARLDMDVILVERRPDAAGPDLIWVEETLAGAFTLDPALSRRYRVQHF